MERFKVRNQSLIGGCMSITVAELKMKRIILEEKITAFISKEISEFQTNTGIEVDGVGIAIYQIQRVGYANQGISCPVQVGLRL